jgi:hypothetical protein
MIHVQTDGSVAISTSSKTIVGKVFGDSTDEIMTSQGDH